MSNIKTIFDRNISTVEDSIRLYQYLSSVPQKIEIDNILRSQIVILVAALDTYLHMKIRHYLMDSYCKSTGNTDITWEIEIATVFRSLAEDEQLILLEASLAKRMRRESYEGSSSIEQTMKKLGIKHIWRTIAADKQYGGADDVKRHLDLIVQRRNQIAHESDWDAANVCYRSISADDVNDSKEFIVYLVKGFENVL